MAVVNRPSLAGEFTPEDVDRLLDAYADTGLVLNPIEVTVAGGPTRFIFDIRCARHGLLIEPDAACALCIAGASV